MAVQLREYVKRSNDALFSMNTCWRCLFGYVLNPNFTGNSIAFCDWATKFIKDAAAEEGRSELTEKRQKAIMPEIRVLACRTRARAPNLSQRKMPVGVDSHAGGGDAISRAARNNITSEHGSKQNQGFRLASYAWW